MSRRSGSRRMHSSRRRRGASSNFSPRANAASRARAARRPKTKMSADLAFTCGDPAGVGPEIIAAWLASHTSEARDVAVIGPAHWLDSLKTSAKKISVGLEEFSATPGTPSGEGALVAWAAMERAAAGTKLGEFSG